MEAREPVLECNNVPSRPLMRYHGGKWRLAKWIISHFPGHRVYVESYAGAASVLLRKPRAWCEVLNDLNGEVVNLFRVLRDRDAAAELIRQVQLTPYAREEFEASYTADDDPVEQARRTLFRAACLRSPTGLFGVWTSGFRADTTRRGSSVAQDWATLADVLPAIVDRLRGVIIEHRPALDVLVQYDAPDTLHYVDPPYLTETRGERWAGKAYSHEMTEQDHRDLAGVLRGLRGHVVLSGYSHPLYAELYPDWQRYTHAAHADSPTPRVEVLWVKPGGSLQRPLLEVL